MEPDDRRQKSDYVPPTLGESEHREPNSDGRQEDCHHEPWLPRLTEPKSSVYWDPELWKRGHGLESDTESGYDANAATGHEPLPTCAKPPKNRPSGVHAEACAHRTDETTGCGEEPRLGDSYRRHRRKTPSDQRGRPLYEEDRDADVQGAAGEVV